MNPTILPLTAAQLAGAVEYTDCITKECPDYDIKQYDSEAPVTLEFLEMQSTTSLPSLPGPLWPGVVALERFLSMGQIKLFDI